MNVPVKVFGTSRNSWNWGKFWDGDCMVRLTASEYFWGHLRFLDRTLNSWKPSSQVAMVPWLASDLRLELRQQREKLQQQLCNLLQQFPEMRGEQEILCLGRARSFIILIDWWCGWNKTAVFFSMFSEEKPCRADFADFGWPQSSYSIYIHVYIYIYIYNIIYIYIWYNII